MYKFNRGDILKYKGPSNTSLRYFYEVIDHFCTKEMYSGYTLKRLDSEVCIEYGKKLVEEYCEIDHIYLKTKEFESDLKDLINE